jgi:hypothetical protein
MVKNIYAVFEKKIKKNVGGIPRMSIGYIAPKDMLEGRQKHIHQE